MPPTVQGNSARLLNEETQGHPAPFVTKWSPNTLEYLFNTIKKSQKMLLILTERHLYHNKHMHNNGRIIGMREVQWWWRTDGRAFSSAWLVPSPHPPETWEGMWCRAPHGRRTRRLECSGRLSWMPWTQHSHSCLGVEGELFFTLIYPVGLPLPITSSTCLTTTLQH